MTFCAVIVWATTTGCRSPYYADQGALFGGVTGAGVGAAIGSASGRTGTGAVLGSAVGALTGAAVGTGMDEIRAENQAMIDQQFAARQQNAASMNDVISMSQAGLSEEVISNHVRTRGVVRPLSSHDLIALKQAGVDDRVIQSMQEMSAVPPPPLTSPVVVEEHYYAAPQRWPAGYAYYGWHHPRRLARRHPPHLSWGVSVRH